MCFVLVGSTVQTRQLDREGSNVGEGMHMNVSKMTTPQQGLAAAPARLARLKHTANAHDKLVQQTKDATPIQT